MSILHQDSMSRSFMRKSVQESDDDTWSSGSSQSSDSNTNNHMSSSHRRWPGNYLLCDDYFGLNNLVENLTISEDNPLLLCTGSNNVAGVVRGGRRVSWESDGSDPASVRSPTLENLTPLSNTFHGKHFSPHNSKYTRGKTQLQQPMMQHNKAQDRIISAVEFQRHNHRRGPGIVADHKSMNEMAFPDVSRPQPASTISSSQPGLPVLASPPPVPSSSLRVCVFCRNNGESESVYTSHILKDTDGRTLCPILRAYTCPICKANGDRSHTIKYCPMNQGHRAQSMGPIVSPTTHIAPTQPHHHSFQRYNGDFRLAVSPANLTINRHPYSGKLRQ